jgi:bacillithiol biosynthesis deacetylase BshB1
MHVDVLACGAHRDDVEITCGGTIAKLVKQGHTVAIVDLTRGEMGTRGSAAIRGKEAQAAAKILGVAARVNVGLPDAFIELNRANKLKVARVIRQFTPSIILAPYWEAHHPDHAATGKLVQAAAFLAGLQKVKIGRLPHHRALRILHYFFQITAAPSFVVDISTTLPSKLAAVRAYQSQFHRPGDPQAETYIARRDFFAEIEGLARHFGARAGVAFGEPFVARETLALDDVVNFFRQTIPIRL